MPDAFQPQQFGNYILVSLLGKGGMAEVYKARSQGAAGFQRVVCVKRILRQHCEDPHFLDMFVNEAKISARLSHPNIVQVYELGEIDGEFFMAMEFVHGKDLLRVMRANAEDGPLPPTVAAFIAREMARALAHAHEHKGDDGSVQPIIHRDVSPQNVMISYDGMVKLVDFGIAKAAHMAGAEETKTGALKGKFAYMAPEQLDGQKATPICDVFAVGVTLHEMLSGRRLFKGNTDFDTLVRVKTQVIPPPSSLNGQVHPELDRIVALSLQRDPAQRYQRAALMARDLEMFCGSQGFAADDMKDYMTKLFPTREEVADGAVMIAPVSNAGASRSGQSKQQQASSSSTAQTPPRGAAAVAPSSSKGMLLIGGVAVLVIGGIGAAFVLKQHGATPQVVTAPLPVVTPPVAIKAADLIIEVNSTPAGAEVTDGPKLLGTTPLEVRITEKHSAADLKLVKAGFDDLVYRVTANDAPSVNLKMVAKKHHSAGAATPSEHHGVKVQSFDDAESKGPKVKTIDD